MGVFINSTPKCMPTEKLLHVYKTTKNLHRSIGKNSKDLETAQVFTHKEMGK